MKRCPTCQKTYADSLKFCQIDGTPLVEDTTSSASPQDPFKTVVGSANSDDILQIPDSYDLMKTMVGSSDAPKPDETKKDSPFSITDKPSSESAPPKDFSTSVLPPKTADSSLDAPPFGDLSPPTGSASSDNAESRSFDSTFTNIEPTFGSSRDTSPFNEPSDAPFGSSQFDSPKSFNVPPPYKEPEPFNPQQSPYGTPQTPFGQSNDPFGSPQFGGQSDWNPPPAPVANWQDQGLGADTPFQPPLAAAGQNQTLAIVSLVTGILGFCCLPSGIAALITGYLAKNNADANPMEYGGRGMALAGMILGGVSVSLTIIYVILRILGFAFR